MTTGSTAYRDKLEELALRDATGGYHNDLAQLRLELKQWLLARGDITQEQFCDNELTLHLTEEITSRTALIYEQRNQARPLEAAQLGKIDDGLSKESITRLKALVNQLKADGSILTMDEIVATSKVHMD